ncbi:MAG TPA: hypothetical protein VJ521_15880, partial [Acidobacteriota bacterium]|nr:hypothetical protein [Acidobacteriota bacterium]
DTFDIPADLIPRQFQQVIRHCLEKNPQKRYQTAHDLALALKAIERGQWQVSSGTRKLWPSIAVLPFIDMSPEKDLEYFCDGIAEELIHALSRLRGLYVTSRTSAFQFKQKALDVRLIGQQLNAATILEGSVRKSGTRLRITAELINTSDGYQIWSERYDREIQDIFLVQENIAGAIVENLKIKLAAGFDQPLVKRYTEDLEAYHLYLKGRYFWAKRYEAGLSKAMDFYLQAIERDPEYAPAYAGIADCYTILGSYGFLHTKTAFDKARAAAEKALELDETLPEAHVAAALISFWYDWNWELAEQSFQHALQLNPNDSPAHIWYATFLSMMGRFPEVEVEIRSAQKLDPLSPLVNSLAGCALYMARAYDEALLEFQKALDVDTDFLVALSFIGSVYIEKSMFNEARAAAERAVKLSSRSSFSLASYGSILAVLGHTEEAQSVIAELQNRSKEQYVPAFCFAMIHIGMKDYDRAFAFLEESLQDRNIQICFLKESPGLDSLRSDPRFRALLHRVPFP